MTESVTFSNQPTYTLWELIRYFLYLGVTGFGGPVALVRYMERDLVEKRQWISPSSYTEGLALSQLAPGPLAAQLAIYMGYVHYGVIGATLVGVAFVLPSFLMVVAMGWVYVNYGGLPGVQAIFYGVGACVVGIITHSAYKLTRRALANEWLLWSIYLVSASSTILTESEDLRIFLVAGVGLWLVKAPPSFLKFSKQNIANWASLPLVFMGLASRTNESHSQTLLEIFLFFSKAGAFVFGSGLAIVPFLYGGVVNDHQWLSESQFVDAVAVAMITPGPVVITVGFIGYLVAGLPGAILASVGTFIPCYLFTILPAPYFRKYGKRPDLEAFMQGVTLAAIGAISGAVVVIGQRTISDIPTALIALITIAILWKTKRIPEPILVVATAMIGLLIYPLMTGG